jgi:soluble P-type ATPase
MVLVIPGRGTLALEHLVLDVNGTVAASGRLIDGVQDRLAALRRTELDVHWITADTRGRQAALDKELGWPAIRISAGTEARDSAGEFLGEAEQKAAFVRRLGAERVVAIGNGANDAAMLREAALGIAVLGPEGLALDALLAADLIAPDILTALEMLQDPAQLIATWRK